ncbi:Cof-type HAD-IIB family hydrolase [Paramaledivibacter caminithermalis]|uniref:Uncharacterized protein n=1 Tax=Paramaledivibacter caminithermalis (strain DSM 15212 / CIP 107654 / DViRD3) TaxID=1121301 RepID=A0A1M6R6F1_PARC5|nr:Cof-type HAD-IIB family hydrolase [Paramaledivibacter caminithermalis]SHK28032.1 hypothetical protein SAMN02745912_02856 [Paramaledivibacter caminithermalis DSM 15212]
MKYKLVVTDMDGTLLNSQGKVPDENKEVLTKLQDNGVHVAVATGRIYTSARIFAKYLGIKTPIIACNGAIVREVNNNKPIYEAHINKDDCIYILEICRKYSVYFHFYTDNTFYTERLEKSALKYSEWNKTLNEEDRINLEVIENAYDFIKDTNEKIYKFLIIDDDENLLKKMRKELTKISGIECCKSRYDNLEIMNKGIQKGVAVKKLADSLGVKREEVICIGDNENDISMIKYAGLGVAMGNAEEIVKQTADYVTDINDNNGVAKALKKFVFDI